MTPRRCPVCGVFHAVCGNPAGAGTGVPVDAGLYGKGTIMAESKSVVERRWVEENGVWRLMKINDQDPRYGDSQPYDPNATDNGMPTKSLAELRADDNSDDDSDETDDDSGDDDSAVRTAARRPAAKKAAAAKRTGTTTKNDSE